MITHSFWINLKNHFRRALPWYYGAGVYAHARVRAEDFKPIAAILLDFVKLWVFMDFVSIVGLGN